MQSLIAIVAACVLAYAFIWAKRRGFNLVSFMRIVVKRIVLRIMSFSWVIVVATLLLLTCYSNLSELLKEILSVNSVSSIKSLVRLVFGVDSAFVALQMLALYSIMVSFISCLILSVGGAVRFVYRAVLKARRAVLTKKEQSADNSTCRVMPTFKLYLKYNS